MVLISVQLCLLHLVLVCDLFVDFVLHLLCMLVVISPRYCSPLAPSSLIGPLHGSLILHHYLHILETKILSLAGVLLLSLCSSGLSRSTVSHFYLFGSILLLFHVVFFLVCSVVIVGDYYLWFFCSCQLQHPLFFTSFSNPIDLVEG